MSETPGADGSSHTWFDILPGDHLSPVLLHVAHASRVIPALVRAGLALDDEELTGELDAMTDAHTDLIAAAVGSRAERRPWQFVNRTSRLVVDPERFPDEREEMAAVGMAAVYRATSTGDRLRLPDVSRDQRLLAEFFVPYADGLADLVDERLAATGRAILLDVHSYPLHPHPYELHQDDARPEICLGVDQSHTPEWLVTAARSALAAIGSVTINEPFRGTYVPLRHYQSDQRVCSLMLEIRRDVYMRPDGSPDLDRIETLAAAITEIVDESTRRA